MKRCPQCNSVFDDAFVNCPDDGTALINENFVLPSESMPDDAEEETLIHHAPVTIDIPNAATAAGQANYRIPPAETVVPVVIESPKNTGKYLLVLIIGLILGGALVLAAVLFGMFLYQRQNPQITNSPNRNSTVNSAPGKKTSPTETVSAKHETPTDEEDDEFNGRVITLNAYVRSSPDRNSTEIDILPINDRLLITEREHEDSPWYRVTCEHGSSGWMHGNTIEYTR